MHEGHRRVAFGCLGTDAWARPALEWCGQTYLFTSVPRVAEAAGADWTADGLGWTAAALMSDTAASPSLRVWLMAFPATVMAALVGTRGDSTP